MFINEIYSGGPKQNYLTNKTDVYLLDDICTLDVLDLRDYVPEKKEVSFMFCL